MTGTVASTPAFPAPRWATTRADGSALPSLLLVLFLVYTFVGVSPLSDVDATARVDGSPLDRIAILSLAALSAWVIALNGRCALRVARRAWLVWAMVGWITASLAWSDFPDLTLRRAISTDLVALIGLALATSLPDARRIHLMLVVVLTGVVLANIAATLLVPSLAISAIGVQGIYQEKNQAGLVGMLAVVVALSWAFQARRPAAILAGLVAAVVSAGFLFVTESKTSMALTVLASIALPVLLVLRRLGPARAGLVVASGSAIALVAALFFTAFDGNWIALASGGDASFTGRTEIWNFALSEIGRRPWSGSGYGAFWDVGVDNDPLLRAPPGDWLSQVKIGVINQAHNGFLDILLQGGIPMLVLALTIWAQAVSRLVRLVFAGSAGATAQVVWVTALILMCVLLVHNFTETSLWGRGQMLGSFSILVTLLAAAQRPMDGAARRGAEPA